MNFAPGMNLTRLIQEGDPVVDSEGMTWLTFDAGDLLVGDHAGPFVELAIKQPIEVKVCFPNVQATVIWDKSSIRVEDVQELRGELDRLIEIMGGQ